MPNWNSLFREIREIVGATARQTTRLFGYGFGIAQTHVLLRKARGAQLALGNRMYEAGVGDEAIRRQIASLDDRIASVALGKGPTKQMEAEKAGLMIRLAADALAHDVAPTGAAAEHSGVISARDAVEAHRSLMESTRADLAPQDTITWRRIGLGYGAVMLALTFATALFLRSANTPGDVSRPFMTDTTPTLAADAEDHPNGVTQKNAEALFGELARLAQMQQQNEMQQSHATDFLTRPQPCWKCGGAGSYRYVDATGNLQAHQCPSCFGFGTQSPKLFSH
jgi:hypothetical protein